MVTVSDTRTPDDDRSGDAVAAALEGASHTIAWRRIVPDESSAITAEVGRACDAADVDAIVLTGGTGIAPRDVTYEAVGAVLDKRLDGFGELFRMISYEEIGPAAMLSRAVAGTVGSTIVFAIPGSTGGCRTAMEKLILPEIAHMVSLANPGKERT